MNMQSPSVGRIVHVHAGDGLPKAAIIVAVRSVPVDGDAAAMIPAGSRLAVDLQVFLGDGTVHMTDVPAGGPAADVPSQGCWTWPPRVS